MSIATIQLKSDRVISDEVARSIRELSCRQIRDIECVYRDGVVTLCGTLASFYLKQIAQSIASKVPGVNRVVNEISVVG
jgi:osmotically-inducible protein OsmY